MKYNEMVVGKEYVVCGSTNKSFTFFGIHEDLERERDYVTIHLICLKSFTILR